MVDHILIPTFTRRHINPLLCGSFNSKTAHDLDPSLLLLPAFFIKCHHLPSFSWHRLDVFLDITPSLSDFLLCIWSLTKPSQFHLLIHPVYFAVIILSIHRLSPGPSPIFSGFLLIHHLHRSQEDFFKKHKPYHVTPVLKTLPRQPCVCRIIFRFSKWPTWTLHGMVPASISLFVL